MDEIQVPLYLIMGFLESGKTSFLQEIFDNGEFIDGEPGLLICCEDGEVSMKKQSLVLCRTQQVFLEEEEELTSEFFQKCQDKYQPGRVFIEYNGMWNPETLFDTDLPDGWGIYQIITIIDASTFSLYLSNMRSLVGNMLKYTELAVFNRCTEDLDLPSFRRNAKALNNEIQIMFEHRDGHMIELGRDIPPYDLNAPVIEIQDEDFGIWYLDASDDRDRYEGKTVRFKGRIMKGRFPKEYFVPGRKAMTCCADDIQFIGFLCRSGNIAVPKPGEWVTVTARMQYEYRREYRGIGPVLLAEDVQPAERPADELVYFN